MQFDVSSLGEKILSVRNTEQRLTVNNNGNFESWRAGQTRRFEFAYQAGFCRFLSTWTLRIFGSKKQLSEHAYGRTAKLPAELAFGLQMMMQRLSAGVPRVVSAKALRQWFVYNDAAYEPELMSGGVGAAIFNDACECVGWFGFPLDTAVPALWCW